MALGRVAGGMLALLLALPALAAEEAATYPYTVAFSGIQDTGLENEVKAQSRLQELQDKGAPSLAALKRRAQDDKDRMDAALRAEGYYEASVTITVDPERQPAAVLVNVDPGPAFTLAAFDVEVTGEPSPQPVPLDRLGIDLGGRARSAAVVKAGEILLKDLAGQGYPLAKISDRQAVVDHPGKTMRVRLEVAAGRLARFGPVTVEGPETIDRAWVLNRVPWETGDRFSLEDMDKFRKRLVDSRLFSSVRLSTAQQLDANGLLPITVALAEAKPRSVGLGANWSTTEGFGGNAFWEDRNLFGGAERLRAQLTGGQIRNALDLTYTGPDFLIPNQDLIAAAKAEEQSTDAFTSRTLGASVGLSWLLAETWRPSASLAVERSLETQRNIGLEPQDKTFLLFSVPLELRHDSTDDVLDPTTGDRMDLTEQPYLRAFGASSSFNRIELYDTQYLKVLDQPRLVLAGWARVGAIQGAELVDVPGSHRLFVGGSGSVRAFGYQMAGPLDPEGKPVGGRSALAFGGEVRIKATDTIGVVPFVEAGRAYAEALPDLSKTLFWGAGLGVRYHTPVGPVRADIAFPVNPREGVDSRYQLYLSLGQAF